MRKTVVLVFICLLSFALLFSACGKTPEDSVDSTDEEITQDMNDEDAEDLSDENSESDEITGTTPAASYQRYLDAKTAGYDSLMAKMESNDTLVVSGAMAMLPITMVDLSVVALVLVTDDIAASEEAGAMLGLTDLDINYSGEDFSISYSDPTVGSIVMQGKYDAPTDSLTCTWTAGGELVMIAEYVTYNEGYAGQYYAVSEDTENAVIKIIVDGEDIGFGISEADDAPASIYKIAPADFSFIDGCAVMMWLQDGIGYSNIDGEETSF